jgi:hypothetical protein
MKWHQCDSSSPLTELLDVNNLEEPPIISLIAADIGATAIVVNKIHSFYYF